MLPRLLLINWINSLKRKINFRKDSKIVDRLKNVGMARTVKVKVKAIKWRIIR